MCFIYNIEHSSFFVCSSWDFFVLWKARLEGKALKRCSFRCYLRLDQEKEDEKGWKGVAWEERGASRRCARDIKFYGRSDRNATLRCAATQLMARARSWRGHAFNSLISLMTMMDMSVMVTWEEFNHHQIHSFPRGLAPIRLVALGYHGSLSFCALNMLKEPPSGASYTHLTLVLYGSKDHRKMFSN